MMTEPAISRLNRARLLKRSICLAVFSAAHLLAQVSTANVIGTVEDSTTAFIPDASVRLLNNLTGTENDSKTNRHGVFLLPGVIPGEYTLQINRDGFAAVQVTGLTLNVGDTKNFLIRMRVGTVTQTVTIDDKSASLDTGDASVNTVVDHNFVANIPLNGRSFQDLISMTPGVETQNPQGAGVISFGATGQFSVNGQQTYSNSFIVDGVSADVGASLLTGHQKFATTGDVPGITAIGTTQSLVAVDALQEFRVLGSTYSTEYGRSQGGQFTFLTRSGNNNFHGDLFDYFRNNVADANDWYTGLYETAFTPHYQQNDFGGAVGGPVELPHLYDGKNRTFFFVSYEGLVVQQPSAPFIQYVPSYPLYQAVPPELQTVFDAFPQGAYGAPGYPSLGLGPITYGAGSYPGMVNATSIRVDHTLSPRLSGFLRYGETPSNSQAGDLSSLARANVNTRTLTLGATAQLSPAMSNDLRVGYAGSSSALTTTLDNDYYPFGFQLGTALNTDLGIPSSENSASASVFLQLPGEGSSEIETDQASSNLHQWNFRDTFITQAAHHLLRLGIDQRHIVSEITPPALSVEADYLSLNSMLENLASDISITRSDPATPVFNEFATFIQDEWRVSKSLTLSPGLRWEIDPPPHGANGADAYTLLGDISSPSSLTLATRGTPLWHTGKLNLAPRFGAVWGLDNKSGRELVLRGGVGVFFETANRPASAAFDALGFSATNHLVNEPIPVTTAQLDFSTAVLAPYTTTAVFLFPQHLQLPYAIQWNVAIERTLGSNQNLTISWVGANGRRLLQEQRENVESLNPTFGEVNYFPDHLTSNYQALEAKFQRSVSRNVQALVSYSWSHTLDYGSTDPAFPLVRSNSDYDVRQNLQAALSWNERFHSDGRFPELLLDGWGIDGRISARTAFPVTPIGNIFSDPATGNRFYSGADLIPGRPLYLYGTQYPGGRIFNGGPDVTNPAFSLPQGATPGDAPRNLLRGFGAYQINLGVRREFSLGRNAKLQLRLDAFNLLNHPIFGYIDPTLTDALFGHAMLSLNQSFGSTGSLYEPGGPRSIQLSVRFHF